MLLGISILCTAIMCDIAQYVANIEQDTAPGTVA
jgi:hypothetical protein